MERIIFHVDVNSAFLSWSAVKQLKEDPASLDLRTIPSAVGNLKDKRRGIVTAKSIPAKAYGVTTGEPIVKALQKCPQLVLVQSDWEFYRASSRAFIAILRKYSDFVEQASVDEAYLDMSYLLSENENKAGNTQQSYKAHAPKDLGDFLARAKAIKIAAAIREEVRTSLGFTVNVGISENKLLAKMASDFKKPDLTHTLWPEEVRSKMWPLPIGALYGCGPKTAARLEGIGMSTIGDAARADLKILQSLIGQKAGEYIYRASRGISLSDVEPEREEAKSYSNEYTTSEDITRNNYEEAALPLLKTLSESVSRRMKKDNVYGGTVTVSVKLSDFHRKSRQTALGYTTNEETDILNAAEPLLKGLLFDEGGAFDQDLGVRLIGVGMSSLGHGEYRQMSLDDMFKL